MEQDWKYDDILKYELNIIELPSNTFPSSWGYTIQFSQFSTIVRACDFHVNSPIFAGISPDFTQDLVTGMHNKSGLKFHPTISGVPHSIHDFIAIFSHFNGTEGIFASCMLGL